MVKDNSKKNGAPRTKRMQRKKQFLSISTVSEMFNVHQQTIRLYEKEGLICPKRSAGNTRLFSESDIHQLEEIIYFTHQLGINLAGVNMILKLKKQINAMQKEMNSVFARATAELEKEGEKAKRSAKDSMKQLIQLKKQAQKECPQPEKDEPDLAIAEEEVDNWEIQYETDE